MRPPNSPTTLPLQECCENLDLETRDPRYDLYRIRSNLCELPTSYISNNCQVTLSNGLTDVMDYLEKYPKGLEWRELSDGMEKINRTVKPKSSPAKYGRGLSCFEKSPLKSVVQITSLEPRPRAGEAGQAAGETDRRTTTYNHYCDTRLGWKDARKSWEIGDF